MHRKAEDKWILSVTYPTFPDIPQIRSLLPLQSCQTGHMTAFTLIDSTTHDSISNGKLQTYHHPSGAVHYHIANDDDHRSFMISFRTLPDDNAGLPHILEHSVLCGSQQFPVRDPFFLMMRRSLQTFMNAMTGGDMTYYPFATQNEQDFFNLLRVYTDAVFKPNLHPLDVAQEGCRIGLDENDNYEFKGVVFNEMKGAMGNADAQLYHAMGEHLLSDTCYRFNSGGEPVAIPDMTREKLAEFHQRFYNPGNCCITTYGHLVVEDMHAVLEPYLQAPSQAHPLPHIQPPSAKEICRSIPVPKQDEPEEVSGNAALVWCWPDTAQTAAIHLGEFIDELLLGHAGAPLRKKLEASGIAQSYAGSGYSSHMRNGLFSIEAKGLHPNKYNELHSFICAALKECIEDGFSQEELDSVLHQLDLENRTIRGDRMPWGLQLCQRIAMGWNVGCDAIAALDINLEPLRQQLQDPQFLPTTLTNLLTENNHRLYITSEADEHFNERQEQALAEKLNQFTQNLTDTDKEALRQQATDLNKRQETPDDPTILPNLQPEDIPSEKKWAESEGYTDDVLIFTPNTNHITHHLAAIPLNNLNQDDRALLGLLVGLIGKVGVGKASFDEHTSTLNSICGGQSGWLDWLNEDSAILFLETRGLSSKAADFIPLLQDTWQHLRFDEHERIQHLIGEALKLRQENIIGQGHSLALSAATRTFSGTGGLSYNSTGMGRYFWLKDVAEQISAGSMQLLCDRVRALHQRLKDAPVLLTHIGNSAAESVAVANAHWPKRLDRSWIAPALPCEAPSATASQALAFTLPAPVNFCAAAYAAPRMCHPDSAILSVTAQYLTDNRLHPLLREQGGAYGGSAGYRSGSGVFAMTSYRDPRLDDTFADMNSSLQWLIDSPIEPHLLNEAILSTIANLDRPGSPAGEARRRWTADLHNRGPELVNTFRSHVLSCTADRMRAVVEEHLLAQTPHQACISSPECIAQSALTWKSISV